MLAVTAAVRLGGAQVYADFQTTLGAITVELVHEDAPRTVANFVSLADGTLPWLDPRPQQVRVGVRGGP